MYIRELAWAKDYIKYENKDIYRYDNSISVTSIMLTIAEIKSCNGVHYDTFCTILLLINIHTLFSVFILYTFQRKEDVCRRMFTEMYGVLPLPCPFCLVIYT